jgi:hypothetical protein
VTNNKPSEVETKRSIVRIHLLLALGPMRLDAIGMRDIERFKAAKLQGGLAEPRNGEWPTFHDRGAAPMVGGWWTQGGAGATI